jgi:SRSO17 transposase
LAYVAGILPIMLVWRPGETPLPPLVWSGRGRRPSKVRRVETHQPVSAKALAIALPADAWQQITCREGSNADLKSRFVRLRVRPAQEDAEWMTP